MWQGRGVRKARNKLDQVGKCDLLGCMLHSGIQRLSRADGSKSGRVTQFPSSIISPQHSLPQSISRSCFPGVYSPGKRFSHSHPLSGPRAPSRVVYIPSQHAAFAKMAAVHRRGGQPTPWVLNLHFCRLKTIAGGRAKMTLESQPAEWADLVLGGG